MTYYHRKYSHLLQIAASINKVNSTNCTGGSGVGETLDEAYEVSYSK